MRNSKNIEKLMIMKKSNEFEDSDLEKQFLIFDDLDLRNHEGNI